MSRCRAADGGRSHRLFESRALPAPVLRTPGTCSTIVQQPDGGKCRRTHRGRSDFELVALGGCTRRMGYARRPALVTGAPRRRYSDGPFRGLHCEQQCSRNQCRHRVSRGASPTSEVAEDDRRMDAHSGMRCGTRPEPKHGSLVADCRGSSRRHARRAENRRERTPRIAPTGSSDRSGHPRCDPRESRVGVQLRFRRDSGWTPSTPWHTRAIEALPQMGRLAGGMGSGSSAGWTRTCADWTYVAWLLVIAVLIAFAFLIGNGWERRQRCSTL